ncbi:MAG: inosine/xanthosine triphosphatase [Methanobacterium sp.]
MKISVGSKNPVKVKAVLNVLKAIYGQVDVMGVDVDSGVPHQPFGKDETIQGAINRAKNAFSIDFDLSVGIESGLMEIKSSLTGFIDLQWCAVFDGQRITLGVSSGFEYPPSVIEEVLKGKEVGEVMDKVTGVNNLGQKEGAVSFLSKGMLDRTENTAQCVLTAMIPRMNNEIYFKK